YLTPWTAFASKARPSPRRNVQSSPTRVCGVASVAEKLAPVLASCMCSFATAPSWHDEQTATVGDMRRLSVASTADAAVAIVEPRMPLAVGASHGPVTWYELPTWQVAQSFSLPGNTTSPKSFTLPPNP